MPVGNGDASGTAASSPLHKAAAFRNASARVSHESARSSLSLDNDGSDQLDGSSFRSASVSNLPQSIRKGYPWANVRRESNLSVSSGLSLDSDASFSTKDFGFNGEVEPILQEESYLIAISGVLNNPSKRGKSSYRPTKSDIPSVPSTNIRKVRPSEFDSYITQIGPEYERYRHNKALGKEGNANLYATESAAQEDVANVLVSNLLKRADGDGISSPARRTVSVNSTPSAMSNGRFESQTELPPLEIIPSYFFEDDFNLGDPRVFDAVTEHNDVVGLAADTRHRALATNAILQEKLSQHMDTVEVHLIKEISHRSTTFFAALSNLQTLHSESLATLEEVRKLRKDLREIDETHAKQGLDIIARKRQRDKIAEVRAAVKVVEEIKNTEPMIKVLLDQGDYYSALDVIDEAWRLLRGEGIKGSNIDLRNVRALSSFTGRLGELYQNVGKMLEQDLLSILSSDMQEYLFQIRQAVVIDNLMSVGLESVKTGEGTTAATMSEQDGADLRERVLPLIVGLVRTDRMLKVMLGYRDSAMRDIRTTIKRRLPSDSGDDDNKTRTTAEKSAILAKALRSMNFDGFFGMMSAIYATLVECLRRMVLHKDIFKAVLKESNVEAPTSISQLSAQEEKTEEDTDTPPRLSEDSETATNGKLTELANDSVISLHDGGDTGELHLSSNLSPTDLTEIIAAAADLGHVRCSKILGVRADQNSKLNMKDFHRYFVLTWAFIVETESLCGRSCFGLRGTISTQAKSFLTHYHMEKMRQMATLIENDQWQPGVVPVDFQVIADLIVKCAMEDPVEFLENQPEADANGLLSPQLHNEKGASNGESKKYIAIEDRQYFVVGCSLLTVKMVADYLRCMINMPLFTTDVMNRLVELLKVFNSRTCQVVLGAGAMRSAGLKNITARHLALASQSLGIFIGLIPYVREAIRRHLTQKQAVMLTEFDRIRRDYQEHQNEIHLKLVAIMNERLTAHIRTFQAINWETEGAAPNKYMETLVKEATILHNVLSKYLPLSTYEQILKMVFDSFTKRLSEEVTKLEIKSESARKRLLGDAEYFETKLSAFENIQGPGKGLSDHIRGVELKQEAPKSSVDGSRPSEPST